MILKSVSPSVCQLLWILVRSMRCPSHYSYQRKMLTSLLDGITSTLKPWTNGVASRRKSKTWGYFATPFGQGLSALALTCDDLRSLWSRSNLHASQSKLSFSPFGHPTQVNASWVTSINLLLANEIEDSLPWNAFFLRLAFTCEETCESVWPPNASLYASSTCLRLRLLAGPFGQGLKLVKK